MLKYSKDTMAPIQCSICLAHPVFYMSWSHLQHHEEGDSKSLKCQNIFALQLSAQEDSTVSSILLSQLASVRFLVQIPLTCFIDPCSRCLSWQNFRKTKDHA